MNECERLFTGKWLVIDRIGKWEFVHRPQSNAAVGILAITDDEKIILVEQFRIPMQKYVLELPAGIVGDEPAFLNESLADSARRELLEETGYECSEIEHLFESPTSAGMSSETTHIFFAKGLKKVSDGGGVAEENILIHEIHLSKLRQTFQTMAQNNISVDAKIYASLAAAGLNF